MKTIYLAGGMRGVDWQAEVSKLLPGWTVFDPKECKSKDPATYTEWDIGHIDRAAVVLAYMDSDNPSGYGLCIEVGYAYSKRIVVFVDAMREDDKRGKYFDMLRVMSNGVFKTLSEAAEYIRKTA